MEKLETLEQFTERMGKVEKNWERQVGRACCGHTRAEFQFAGQFCYCESTGWKTYSKLQISELAKAVLMVNSPEPSESWWTDFTTYGKKRSEKIAKYYNATISNSPYAETEEEEKWYFYEFQTFEDLMKFVYDRHTGEFENHLGSDQNIVD